MNEATSTQHPDSFFDFTDCFSSSFPAVAEHLNIIDEGHEDAPEFSELFKEPFFFGMYEAYEWLHWNPETAPNRRRIRENITNLQDHTYLIEQYPYHYSLYLLDRERNPDEAEANLSWLRGFLLVCEVYRDMSLETNGQHYSCGIGR